MKALIKIFRFLPPESAHFIGLLSLKILNSVGLLKTFFPLKKTNFVPRKFFGLEFRNTLGVAAGLDKNGDFVDVLDSLGFGFIEIGTTTPEPQKGNPKPRVFRYTSNKAVINRLGFNNKGVDYLASKIKNKKFNAIIGVNIGANKTSTKEKRIEDYKVCFEKIYQYADYVTVNISSPNTPELRNLHDPNELEKIFESINSIKIKNASKIPVFLKISPDEDDVTIEKILKIYRELQICGLIVSNTSVDKNILENCQHEGGISGKPLFNKSSELIRKIKQIDDEVFLIGVGGVFSKNDYQNKISDGASLIQVYTGFIYEGPSIVKNILS